MYTKSYISFYLIIFFFSWVFCTCVLTSDEVVVNRVKVAYRCRLLNTLQSRIFLSTSHLIWAREMIKRIASLHITDKKRI